MTCEFCTGTHWLNDDEDLGQCVCCTPEAMTAVEEARDDMSARLDDYVASDPADALADYLTSIGLSYNDVWYDNDNLDALVRMVR